MWSHGPFSSADMLSPYKLGSGKGKIFLHITSYPHTEASQVVRMHLWEKREHSQITYNVMAAEHLVMPGAPFTNMV